MKKIRYITFCIGIVFFLNACVDKDPDFNAFTLELNITSEDSIPSEFLIGQKVTITNTSKNYSFSQTINDSVSASFTNLEPDFYRVTFARSFTEEGVAYNINGLLEMKVFESGTDTLEVFLSETNAFVIKQYYYSACLTEAGNQYSSDQFIEIHNNSDQPIYADGISLIEHESYSLDDSYWGWLEDTIVARMIWTIPGDGDDVLLEPGASIVIARDGINHQDDSLGNPLCPVNLEHADFEFWVESASASDIDAPFAKNMIENLFTYRGTDVVFHTRGGSAIALALFPGTHKEKQEFIDNHLTFKISTPDRFYGKVPTEYILDAVEVTWDEDHAVYKRFPLDLDAGYTYVPAGARSGLGLRRKVKEVVDGRFIYQDTNNSTNDFEKDVVPNPWVNEE